MFIKIYWTFWFHWHGFSSCSFDHLLFKYCLKVLKWYGMVDFFMIKLSVYFCLLIRLNAPGFLYYIYQCPVHVLDHNFTVKHNYSNNRSVLVSWRWEFLWITFSGAYMDFNLIIKWLCLFRPSEHSFANSLKTLGYCSEFSVCLVHGL